MRPRFTIERIESAVSNYRLVHDSDAARNRLDVLRAQSSSLITPLFHPRRVEVFVFISKKPKMQIRHGMNNNRMEKGEGRRSLNSVPSSFLASSSSRRRRRNSSKDSSIERLLLFLTTWKWVSFSLPWVAVISRNGRRRCSSPWRETPR